MSERARGWLRRLVLLAVAAVLTVVVVRLLGRIDWAGVGDALGRLEWWHPLVLVGLLLVRQVLNALPLALFIPGISPYRATLNDQAAILVATVAPPPSDLALRIAIFGSWGVPAAKAVAGTVMNTLTFYVVRFTGPAVGFLLLALTGEPPGPRWLELVSIAFGLGVLVVLVVVVHTEALARATGRTGARLVGRVRRGIDPDVWAQRCADFRGDVAARFTAGFPRSLLALAGMMALDLTMLTCCLRFVGVGAAEVAVVEVAIAYLFAYPFTLFPFQGIGVVDALVLAALVDAGGDAVEAASVAALVVWRVFTVAGPVLLGVLALAVWRRQVRTANAS